MPSLNQLQAAVKPSTSTADQHGHDTSPIDIKSDIERLKKVPEQKSMSSAEMEAGGYQEKIQETSHETVNHVRRLAMKNKRNDR